jgi:dihydrofolate reductase
MFGPLRGPWEGDVWKGWWGKDVRIGGGVSVIRQCLIANRIDEMHLALSPVLLGEGEHLFSGINLPKLGFAPFRTVPDENATHVLIRKT